MKNALSGLMTPLYVGLGLIVLYLVQYLFEIRWTWLNVLQEDQLFRRWSGLAIGLIIVMQWMLTMTRTKKSWNKHAQKFASVHKWMGALSPILFYTHSIEFGHAYLLVFSIIFMLNTVLGCVNLDVIKSHKEWIFQGWMITHVTLSIIITAILLIHVWVVFYYK